MSYPVVQMQKRLPVGIDSFEKLRNGNYYYVDKTALIEQVLEIRKANWNFW